MTNQANLSFRMVPVLFLVLVLSLALSGCWVPDTFEFKKSIGVQGKKAGEFYGLISCYVTRSGGEKLLALENLTKRGQIFGLDGQPEALFGGDKLEAKFRMNSPISFSVNPVTFDIAVADPNGGTLHLFTKTGSLKKVFRDAGKIRGLTFDKDGKCYVVTSRSAVIDQINVNGSKIAWEKKIGGSGDAKIRGAVALDYRDDFLYVLEDGGRRVIKIGLDGKVALVIKSKGDYGDFLSPKGLCVDVKGNIYVSDTGEIPCVKFGPDGVMISRIGQYGSEQGQLMSPGGISVAENGAVFICDTYQNQIQVFAPEKK